MRPSWALLEHFLAVLEACWAMLAALLGRFGVFGEPQGGSMAAGGPPGVGVVQSTMCDERGWGGDPLEDHRNPARQHLAFFHASTCQGARWRMADIYIYLYIYLYTHRSRLQAGSQVMALAF